MFNSDLEKFYKKIDGSILLISAFIEDKKLEKIIRSCRLKPYSLFTGKMKTGTNIENYWVDEYGNSLVIENKEIRIILNDLSIEKNTKISTDLFYGREIVYFIDSGRKAYIYNNIVSIYGEDEYLRSFIFEEQWVNISSLVLGINNLNNIFDNKNVILLPRCRDVVIKHISSL